MSYPPNVSIVEEKTMIKICAIIAAFICCGCSPDGGPPWIDRKPSPVVPVTPVVPQTARIVVEVAQPPAAQRSIPVARQQPTGYPVRGGWWSHPGGSRADLISHLMSGQHAGKFSHSWLQSLTTAQLESLHSDDHEGRIRLNASRSVSTRSPQACPTGNCPTSSPFGSRSSSSRLHGNGLISNFFRGLF